MQPHEIEEMLGRLMPVAISDEGQRSMDEMLDELAGEDEPVAVEISKNRWWRYVIPPAGIAAATAFAFFGGANPPAEPVETTVRRESPGVVLVGESGRIETFSDEGWVADSQGGALQAVRVRVVEENTMQDEATGIVFQVSEPREEMILYPVNRF